MIKMVRVLLPFLMILLAESAVAASGASSAAVSQFVDTDSGLLESFIFNGAYVVGVLLVVLGVLKLKNHSQDPARNPMSHGVAHVVVGSIMLVGPLLLNVVEATIFGSSGAASGYISIQPRMASVNSGTFSVMGGVINPEMGKAIIGFLVLVGLLSFFRGLYMLKEVGRADVSNGQGPGVGKALTHIIGGAMAVNIVETSCLIGTTIGFPALCV